MLASGWNRPWSCRWCPSVTISCVLVDNYRPVPDLDPVQVWEQKKNRSVFYCPDMWSAFGSNVIKSGILWVLHFILKRHLCWCIHNNTILKIRSLPVFWKGLQRAEHHFYLHTSSYICNLFRNTSLLHQTALTAEPQIKSFLCLLATCSPAIRSSCGIKSCMQPKKMWKFLPFEKRHALHFIYSGSSGLTADKSKFTERKRIEDQVKGRFEFKRTRQKSLRLYLLAWVTLRQTGLSAKNKRRYLNKNTSPNRSNVSLFKNKYNTYLLLLSHSLWLSRVKKKKIKLSYFRQHL